MKRQIGPLAGGVLLLIAIGGVCYILYYRSFVQGAGDTQLPPEVVRAIREKGPQPMPPMPMPSGRYFAPRGGALGPPPGAQKPR